MTASRLPTGGTHIDRSTSIAFEFDGRTLTGFAGDTVASALARERHRCRRTEHLPRPASGDRVGGT